MSPRLKDALGWAAVVLVGVVAFVVTRPKGPGSGRVDRPGPAATEAGPAPARASFGARLDRGEGGLRVVEAFAGGNAARAGLVAGDTILRVDGQAAAEPKVLLERLSALGPGGALVLAVRRADGRLEDLRVTLAAEAGFERDLAARLIAAGVAQLTSLRRADGLWPHYQDPARPSVGVTALVARALARVEADLPAAGREALEAARRALLAAQAPDGGLHDPAELVPHRVYATALAVQALEGVPAAAEARGRLARWLRDAQVGEAHGFDVVDARYGGWSYYDVFAPASRLRTDVSTLRFALEGLAAGRAADDDPAWDRARLWLDAAQNLTLATGPRDPTHARERELRDGGFGFTPRMSKAGSDAVGPSLAVFRSYGSATADGALGLLLVAGVDRSGERSAALAVPDEARAALAWLARRWSVGGNPGFERDDTGWAQGVVFYYLAALAQVLHRAGVATVVDGAGAPHDWAGEVVRQLGTLHARAKERFSNPEKLMHEDSPAVAAAFAVLALAAARDRLALGGGATLDGGGRPAPRPADVVVGAAAPDAVARGRAAFARAGCAGCHVDAGGGNGPSLLGVGERALARWRTGEAAVEGLAAFVRAPDPAAALSRGAWAARMPPVGPEQLDDAALRDVAAFLASRRGDRPVSEAR